ncbi:MAG: hypothetical protein LIO46_07020 [Clostridiales bacterium]|nr:hypothetical protein [Clostridiales bacterium]
MEQQAVPDFWSVSIYVDKDRNLIGIPCGWSEQYGVADIDMVLRLRAPYDAPRMEPFVEEVIEACYTKRHNDESRYSTIEKFMKIKGFAAATRTLTLITVVKTEADGYSIMASFNDRERGPIVIDDDEVKLPVQYHPGEMAEAIERMIEIYGKANQMALEQE